MTVSTGLFYSLLDEPLIRFRQANDGSTVAASLPQLLAALAANEVRDYPALRPHQRHPWHAFLVQLAAIALHKANQSTVFETADLWRNALIALTSNDPDGAPWCLVSPPHRPALLQAPVGGQGIDDWKSLAFTPDAIDMLVTAKNHDLKGSRARRSQPEDWLFALLSLQTQEGFLGAGNYGVSRMNGGFASRPGVGIADSGLPGLRWMRDLTILLTQRGNIAESLGMQSKDGLALIWLKSWDGTESLSFTQLDPFYIEICRRIRLQTTGSGIKSLGSGSKCARVNAKELNGKTGDAWTPIDIEHGKALTITSNGFSYKLLSDLLFFQKYQAPIAQQIDHSDQACRLVLIAQGVTRGQGKTERYHERRVPISAKVKSLLANNQKEQLASKAKQRIEAISAVRKHLWLSLTVLFENGKSGVSSDGTKTKANVFAAPFEHGEDGRFFDDLNEELEATDQDAQNLQWQLQLVSRAEKILKDAFNAGPRNGIQKYRARSAALSRFHGGLRGTKSPLPSLANYYRQQSQQPKEHSIDHT